MTKGFRKNPSTSFKSVDSLSKKEAAEEVEALRDGINYHDYLYYVKNQPEISDKVYDKLFQRLVDLEATFPDLKSEDSPTLRVGAEPVSKLKKVKHTAPLLSLQATLEETDIKSFLEHANKTVKGDGLRFSLEPKFDGLSVEIVYKEGHFDYGSTRGNGEVGEDISHNLKTIRTLPLALQHRDEAPKSLAVRGEVFMPKKGFTEMNKKRVERGDEPFANPRNAAAGLMRQYKSKVAADTPMDIFFYDVLSAEGDLPEHHAEILAQLSRWGLKTCPLNQSATTQKQIADYHSKLVEQRDGLDFEVDGIVVKVDDYDLRETLGTRENNPRWAIAWKFEPRDEVTFIEDIVVNVGRTGILTPVALLQPVDVGGVTVSRATLHNADEVARKDIRVGDKVHVIRAGDVIPEIKERLKQRGKKRGKPFKMPTHCPVCNSEVMREGAYFLCPAGLSCSAQLVRRIQHYAARDAMDIDHLGGKTTEQLVDRELLHDLADLYRLKADDIATLDGFAEKSAGQLYDAIQGTKKTRLDHFLFALGINHVGRRVARIIAREFGSLDKVIAATKEKIEKIPGIGEEIAVAVANFFEDSHNRDVLERMDKAGLTITDMPRQHKQPLKDKTFVFTGSLERFTRDEAKERVESLGGRATSSVSSETDYVVVGESPGSKLDEAKKHDVERLNEEEFLKLLEQQ